MTIEFGLDARARALIVAVLRGHREVREAQIFGSRAMGRYRPESDVDIVLFGDVDATLQARIAGELDELPLPYAFDVHAYGEAEPSALREHIDRVGRPIFTRE